LEEKNTGTPKPTVDLRLFSGDDFQILMLVVRQGMLRPHTPGRLC
jgi:hypothetical protein